LLVAVSKISVGQIAWVAAKASELKEAWELYEATSQQFAEACTRDDWKGTWPIACA
jgi:hypothetical protein